VVLAYQVPRYLAMWESLNAAVSDVTKLVFQLSYGVRVYWWLLLPASAAGLALDGGIYFALRRSSSRWPATLWSVLVLLGELGLILLVGMAMRLPIMPMQSMPT
jgi:hypothetical protein